MYGSLTVEGDAIKARISHGTDHMKKKSSRMIRTREELFEWVNEYGITSFLCSSSLDFPEEYTEDESIIELCDAIRNG